MLSGYLIGCLFCLIVLLFAKTPVVGGIGAVGVIAFLVAGFISRRRKPAACVPPSVLPVTREKPTVRRGGILSLGLTDPTPSGK
jgi:di/tricarboxylate transporter